MLALEKNVTIDPGLMKRLSDARALSDGVFNIVHKDGLYDRPIPERHRIAFYIGHLEAFDWNLLHERVLDLKSFQYEFDRLFAFGIDPVGGGLPTDQPADWPRLHEILDYVSRIRTSLDERIAPAMADLDSSVHGDLSLLLNVAIEHRLMHVETLAYMLHQMPLDRKVKQADLPDPVCAPVTPAMISIPGGQVTLGLRRDGSWFGWDNEFESHTVRVPGFEVDQYKVTNQQYLKFITDGGYDDRTLWSDDDWNWKTANGISNPVFWNQANGNWRYRTMFAEIPLPWNWPVYVSQAEASAYARWAGKSLPTEAQWQRAAHGNYDSSDKSNSWSSCEPDSTRGNFDFRRWSPVAVNAFPRGQSAIGVEGMLGNGWEWTSTAIAPFPGFEPFRFYRGYSADFFDGNHFVMKGGSSRTARCMMRPTFRNWFQAHYQYVYAGFRCVRN